MPAPAPAPAGPLVVRRVRSAGPEATSALALHLGRALCEGGVRSLMLALEGELGAGKTLFVRGLARGLGLDARTAVPSPTFILAQHFALPGGGELHHVDAYRLRGVEELEAAGLEEVCGEGRFTCVEWAGRVAAALPVDRLEVELLPCDLSADRSAPAEPGEGREIVFRAWGARSAALLATWRIPQGEVLP